MNGCGEVYGGAPTTMHEDCIHLSGEGITYNQFVVTTTNNTLDWYQPKKRLPGFAEKITQFKRVVSVANYKINCK